ncbi:MAG: CHRD domain-containing protein [Pirellulales bacterium]|nr:CHRD domain-containing protein [Pirellulales bacterium]
MKSPLTLIALALTLLVGSPAARSAPVVYTGDLNGPADGTDSPGTGKTFVTYDDAAHTLRVQLTFQGLKPQTAGGQPSGTTAAHIHAPTAAALAGTASVATQTPTFSGLPLGVTSGSMDQTLDLTTASSWNASFISSAAGGNGSIATAEANFADYLASGRAYLNLHTTAHGGGEIRAFLVPVPEPAAMVLGPFGAIALLVRRRRR